ncbi:MAG: ATP-binding protein, partial [Chloroflexi bacterium]|nr:ATP-binding protein [Chloroflexota bacterium]
MRIAFVGKGGSGKTTCAALFTQHVLNDASGNVWAVDADLNMHLAEQLGVDATGLKHISDPASEKDIKAYLRGGNGRIKELSHFKKTTPPGEGSGFIVVRDSDNYVLRNYASIRNNLFLSIVGSYDPDGIGASCYHNNLAVLESMLSHTIDEGAHVIVDMVAGVDAFAGTLHAQIDLVILVTEPPKKSVDVYK